MRPTSTIFPASPFLFVPPPGRKQIYTESGTEIFGLRASLLLFTGGRLFLVKEHGAARRGGGGRGGRGSEGKERQKRGKEGAKEGR